MPYDHGVALGEAFVNVRADLKPFAKDLEKGLKQILLAAEKKIVADGSTGRGIQAALAKKTEDGVSDGLDKGLDKGMKAGTKKALTTGQKFFAALGDFADDGLSALPAKVKAVIVLGVVGAGLIVAPLLAGFISAAITSGLALGVLGLGILVAAQFKAVSDQFTALGRNILERLRDRAVVFITPLLKAAVLIQDRFDAAGKAIGRIFAAAATLIDPLTRAITGFVQQLLPGIETAVRKARPLIEALASSLPQLGRDFAVAFAILGDGSAQSAQALKDFLALVGQTVIGVAALVRALSDLYFWLLVVAAAGRGDFATTFELLINRENALRLASGQVVGPIEDVNEALKGTANEANAANQAISGLVTEMFKSLNGTIQYEEAIDNLRDAFKEGNRTLDVGQEKGRANLRLVEQAIAGAAAQRDAEIAKAAETHRSIESINADYQRQIDGLVAVTGKIGQQDKKFKELIATARGAPSEVVIEVQTPGLGAAIGFWKSLASAIRSAVAAGAAYVKQGSGGQGTRTAVQYAAGDIVTKPTFGLVGEAGYAEAVIPDPAVMPGRAMELSNKFGLTSMIADALGAGQSIVNVYLGTQRLDERIDYRVNYSNGIQAQSLAYGPRAA